MGHFLTGKWPIYFSEKPSHVPVLTDVRTTTIDPLKAGLTIDNTPGIVYKHTNRMNGKAYIGYTTQSMEERWDNHLRAAKSDPERSCRYINNAIRSWGVDVWDHEVLGHAIGITNLKTLETAMIDKHGTLSPGGYNLKRSDDNSDGLGMYSEESRERLSLSVKQTRQTPESRAKTSLASKASWTNPQTRAKRAASVKQFWEDNPEARAAHSKRIQERSNDPAYIARLCAASSAHRSTPEARKAHTAMITELWTDPEFRAKVERGQRELANDPERSAALSAKRTAALHKRYEDPAQIEKKAAECQAMWAKRTKEQREAIGAAISAAKSTPEAKAKTSEQLRNRECSPATGRLISAHMKASWQDPAVRAKRTAWMLDDKKVKAASAKTWRTRRIKQLLERQIARMDWSADRICQAA